MKRLIYLLATLVVCSINFSDAQRVAPGVPPQQYRDGGYQAPPQQQYAQGQVPVQQQQYQVPQQQYQAPQQQFQQAPVQQQVPQQQQHVPQQQQHVPQQYGHGPHHKPHGQPQQVLNAANIAHEKEHIQEHMEVPIDTSKMSEQELQFHYFKMHDADNNNKLDGCELIKSLIHWHEHGGKEKQGQAEEKVFKDEELVNLIDPILGVDDQNQDGYIDYPEFIRAQQAAAGQNKQR